MDELRLTDELRRFANEWDWLDYKADDSARKLRAIADRIDAEHERVTMNVMNDALYQANEDDMAELGWIRLPKDANGEYVNIGDVMAYADGNTCPMKVVALVPPSVFLTDDGPRYADMCRHYKPTVVDVLREFGDWYAHTKGGCDEDGIIAEYAAMFQLKENE